MVPDAKEANKEEQPVEMITKIVITKIAETHADVVMADTGLEYFMTKFPNMKKLDIDLCGLITSQPGEGTFKHDPRNNAIAVFLLKGQVKRYHYVLVTAIQSLVLFMYHWDGKYFGRNVLDAALNRNYNEVIRLMEPYIVLHKKRSAPNATEDPAEAPGINVSNSPRVQDLQMLGQRESRFNDGYDSDGGKGPFLDAIRAEGDQKMETTQGFHFGSNAAAATGALAEEEEEEEEEDSSLDEQEDSSSSDDNSDNVNDNNEDDDLKTDPWLGSGKS
eukprot:jgi/Psemu1/20034/gm1.20034_g